MKDNNIQFDMTYRKYEEYKERKVKLCNTT